MNIKTKLGLALGLLYFLIITSVGFSIFFLEALSRDSENILDANYNSIEYSRLMLNTLDEDLILLKNQEIFESNLNQQRQNITEEGEKLLTDKLVSDYTLLKSNPADPFLQIKIRKHLTDIMEVNMKAIQRKGAVAANTAKTASVAISVTGCFCFLWATILLFNLPGSIINPLKKLNNSIKEIVAENYAHRVEFDTQNEFSELATSFNKMAAKLNEYNTSNLAKLMMEKKRIEILINNMLDPVIGLDEDKAIIFINDSAIKITGVKKENILYQRAPDIAVQHDLMRILIQGLEQRSTSSKKTEPIKIFADGKESYFQKEMISIDFIPTAETHSLHAGDFILLKNITPFKELDVAKTNFIATVSHELKTPISSLLMSLQLLENEKTGNINDTQRQLIDSVKDDGKRLLKITGELLNFSQVETGNIQLSIQYTEPKKIVQYALDTIKTQAEQKQLNIQFESEPDLPMVKADAEKTAWVLVNLLTNAIRYSPEKTSIVVKLTNENTHHKTSFLKFSVQDFGNGIEEKYLHKIFDRYFQVPGSNKSGTGLGLAICKEFIEAQGGMIWADSALGSGSTFHFTLMV